MRKLLYNSFLIYTILLTSCLDQVDVQPPDSIYKEDILSYFDKLQNKITNDFQKKQIEELTQSIDFKRLEIYNLRTTEKVIISDLKPLKEFEKTDKLKAIFFINQGEIVRSNIVSINRSSRYNKENNLILSILNMQNDRDNFTGKISFFSPFQKLLLVNEFENGQLKVNGIARKVDKKLKTGKTNGCIDWYLIRTWYYSWGTVTTEAYLFTTCDDGTGCEEEAYRVGRVNCVGGGGSNGGSSNGPTPPSNPQHGDIYEYADKDGKYTKYQFDSTINTWTIVEVILPPLVIQNEPENYPFLQIQWPVQGYFVYGPDNITYTYDGYSGNWRGVQTILNNVTDPCISQQVNNAISESMTNEISTLIKNIYNVSDNINLTIDQVNYLDGSVDAIADGYTTPTGSLNIDISFNGNTIPYSSQEYIMATLYHEFLHAILFHRGIISGNQHEPIATGYINILANALREHFPNLSVIDATRLAWGGLQETTAWSNLSSSEQASIIATNNAYRNRQSGTGCN